MAGTKEPVRIKLTPEQQQMVKQVTGKNAESLELSPEELEERIDRALGFPTHDPHGDPIPDANLEWPGSTGGRRTSALGA